jgi:hypothetical protein
MIGVVVKAGERELLERAAGAEPVSTWMRAVSLEAARAVAQVSEPIESDES